MQASRLNFTQPSTPSANTSFLRTLRVSPALTLSISSVALVCLLWLTTTLTTSFFHQRIETLQVEIQALQPKRLLYLEESILQVPPQLTFANKKFREHIYITNVFDFLRENTLRQVTLTGVEFQQQGGRIATQGSAKSFEDLAKQISFLKDQKNVSQLEVSNISLSEEGLVQFNLLYSLSPKILLAP